MNILPEKYLHTYQNNLFNLPERIKNFLESSKSIDFDFCLESSSVYSSNIEWNTLDLNSFMNQKWNKNITKDVKEIENLVKAYTFSMKNTLNEMNFLESHGILSKTLLIKSKRWIYRDDKVWIFWKQWLIYLAIEAEFVSEKMHELFVDVMSLLEKELTPQEVFYYASLIHLVFVHIHPFADGNGRSARLLEKWFITSKLWYDFWKLPSEEYYKNNRNAYYMNINLWVNYYELDYNKCLDFLNMLPQSLWY